jgi:adhesin/invasin
MRALLILPLVYVLVGCDKDAPLPTRPSPVASQVAFSISPQSLLLSGSSVQVSARFRDPQGTNVTQTPVTFTTSTGTLSAATINTDDAGFATVTLAANEAAYLTASTSSAAGAVSVPAVAPFSVSVTPNGSIVEKVPALMIVSLTPGAPGAPSPSAVTLACGLDGAKPISGGSGTCTFDAQGFYPVTAAATINGWTTTATTMVDVRAAAAPPPAPAPIPPSPAQGLQANVSCIGSTSNRRIACNVTSLAYNTRPVPISEIDDVDWDWGDGSVDHAQGPARSHEYGLDGTYQIHTTVTAQTADGTKTTVVVTDMRVPTTTTTTPARR